MTALPPLLAAMEARLQASGVRLPARVLMALVIGLAGTVASLFWFFTPTILYHPPERIRDFAALCANPFTRDLTEPFLAYRIFTPALAWLLGLRGISGLALQYVALAGLLATVFALLRREAGNVAGLAAVAALGGTFTVIWSSGYAGFPDSVSHLFVALALLSRRPSVTFLTLTAAGLNDERAFLALPLVVLWQIYLTPDRVRRVLLAHGAAAVGAVIAVWFTRQALTHGLIGPGITRPTLYGRIHEKVLLSGQPWDSTWGKFSFNVFMAYRWLWLMPLLACIVPASTLQRRICVLALAVLVAGSLSTVIVADVSRSVGFLFPALLLALLHLLRTPGLSHWRWAAGLLLLQLLTPVFYHVGDWSGHCRPYPVEWIRLVTGIDPVDVVLRR